MKLKLFITMLFLSTVALTALGQGGVLKGVVMEKGTSSRIAAAEVMNKRTKVSVSSNDLGLFQIGGQPGDTLYVYKSGFSELEVPVASTADVVIYLNKGISLDEVSILGQSKKQELNEIKREFRNKGSFYGGKPPLLSYVFTPLTAIYELFGRTPKNARRFNNYYNNELEQTQVDQYFNASLIQKYTDLEGKELEDFMLSYRPEYEKVKNWSDYDALKYIKETYKKYKGTL